MKNSKVYSLWSMVVGLSKQKLFAFLCLLLTISYVLYTPPTLHAVECGDSLPGDESALQEYIKACNSKLSELSGKKATLSEAISYLNTQISLAQAKISSTQQDLDKLKLEIEDLSGKIDSIDYSLDTLTKLFVARVRASYVRQSSKLDLTAAQLESLSIPDFIRQLEYSKKVRDHDQDILISLETSRIDFNNQKTAKETKQAEYEALQSKLSVQRAELSNQKTAKDALLAETKNDEKRYQSLRQQASNRVAELANYAKSRGGSSLLSGTTQCDDWGCYYNQRDSQWGSHLIGNSSSTMASVGCLVTSAAMIATHYGRNITPGDIASSSDPFEYDTADMRFTWLGSVGGAQVTRSPVSCYGSSCKSIIDSELASNRPVIVRITAASVAGTHFIVITKKEGDDYIMKDPYESDGNNIPFTSKHSIDSMTRVDRVSVN